MWRTDVDQRRELCYIISSSSIDGGSKLSSMLISSHNPSLLPPTSMFLSFKSGARNHVKNEQKQKQKQGRVSLGSVPTTGDRKEGGYGETNPNEEFGQPVWSSHAHGSSSFLSNPSSPFQLKTQILLRPLMLVSRLVLPPRLVFPVATRDRGGVCSRLHPILSA